MNTRYFAKIATRLLWEEDGPTAVEYAVMLSLIVAACVGAVHALANSTRQSFDDSAEAISNAMGGP